jgi:hypothetical protein
VRTCCPQDKETKRRSRQLQQLAPPLDRWHSSLLRNKTEDPMFVNNYHVATVVPCCLSWQALSAPDCHDPAPRRRASLEKANRDRACGGTIFLYSSYSVRNHVPGVASKISYEHHPLKSGRVSGASSRRRCAPFTLHCEHSEGRKVQTFALNAVTLREVRLRWSVIGTPSARARIIKINRSNNIQFKQLMDQTTSAAAVK